MEGENIQNRKNKSNIRLELIIWFVIDFLIWFWLITATISHAHYLGLKYVNVANVFGLIFEYKYFFSLLAIIVLLFPFLFKLIYGELPFQHIRNVKLKKVDKNKIAELPKQNKTLSENDKDKSDFLESTDTKNTVKELDIIEIYLKQSQKLSEQVLSRSSAYLLIGCLIAFAGVIFFYFQSFYANTTATDFTEFTLRETLPRIGVLIFVEAIAFFFLKQYKSTMEEFRYYEAIKRQRENQYLIANYAISNKDNIDNFMTIIDKLNLNENPNKLSKDETTQLLENQKISTQESNLIEKVIDMLKIIRKE